MGTKMCGDYLINYVCVFFYIDYIAYDISVPKRKTIFS